jgi:hypothetical protein
MAKETVKIKLPLTRKESDNEGRYVAINGKPYQIKIGVPVEVPASVAEVLEHSDEMQVVAMEFEASASEKLK